MAPNLLNTEMTLPMLIPKQATLKFEYYEEKGGVRRVTKPAVQNIKQPADFYVDVVRNIQGFGRR